MRAILWATALALVAGGALGCVRHVHHHHPAAYHAAPVDPVVLEREHEDRTVIIVKQRPEPHRHCWKHRRHWHCRAR